MYIFYIMRILTLIFHPIPSILAFHWQVGEPLRGQPQEVIEAAAQHHQWHHQWQQQQQQHRSSSSPYSCRPFVRHGPR